MRRLALFVLAALMITACGSKKQETAGVNREELTFPFGEQLPAPPFTGEAYIHQMIAYDSIFKFPATNNITFAPGAHSSWHRHGGMVVMVTGGVGLYQEEGKPAQVLRKGDVLQIPAGVRHWHGATQDNWFSQIVIYDAAWQNDEQVQCDEVDNTVSDEYYNSLQLEEYAHQTPFEGLMFAAPDSTMSLPTFNGPIRLANTLDAPNVAGSPSLHYVVFEPGVINAWHTHPGGQILIATDGIGYHQIEGQPVEVLHPGDVVMCPPDVKHWHGAAPGSRFAHLAAGTNAHSSESHQARLNGRVAKGEDEVNPDKPAVIWTDEILSKEEYDKLPKE